MKQIEEKKAREKQNQEQDRHHFKTFGLTAQEKFFKNEDARAEKLEEIKQLGQEHKTFLNHRYSATMSAKHSKLKNEAATRKEYQDRF